MRTGLWCGSRPGPWLTREPPGARNPENGHHGQKCSTLPLTRNDGEAEAKKRNVDIDNMYLAMGVDIQH